MNGYGSELVAISLSFFILWLIAAAVIIVLPVAVIMFKEVWQDWINSKRKRW